MNIEHFSKFIVSCCGSTLQNLLVIFQIFIGQLVIIVREPKPRGVERETTKKNAELHN